MEVFNGTFHKQRRYTFETILDTSPIYDHNPNLFGGPWEICSLLAIWTKGTHSLGVGIKVLLGNPARKMLNCDM